MGLFLGIVQNYNKTKGHITLKLKEPIEIGDTISLQNEEGSYTISELMLDKKNITETQIGQISCLTMNDVYVAFPEFTKNYIDGI